MKAITPSDNRFRGSYRIYKQMEDFQLSFMQESPLNRRKVPTGKVYRLILSTIFKKIVQHMLFDGYVFRYRKLGKFYCAKYAETTVLTDEGKVKTTKKIDYPSTYKARREFNDNSIKVYYDNRNTGGYVYQIFWDTSRVHFSNKTFYKLKLEKAVKAQINKGLNAGILIAREITKT